jgi:hypothetical protein
MNKYAHFALVYVLWVVSIIAGIFVALQARDAIINAINIRTAGAMQGMTTGAFDLGMRARAASAWSYLILGVVMIVFVVWLEHYYRTAGSNGKLLARFLKITAWTLAILGAGHAIYFIAARSANLSGWTGILVPAVEFILAALFWWLSSLMARKALSTQTL